jgi:curved DNA-binding protein CbpA
MTHYDVLGVARDAATSEVRRAYVDLARRHHPDRAGGDPARMRAINEAWSVLGDPDRRHRYDLELGTATAGTGWAAHPPGGGGAVEADDAADLDDLDDYRPFGDGVPASGWFAVVPVALFGASIGLGVLGVLLGLPAVVGGAVLAFALSCLAFVAAPLLALYSSRRGTGAGGGAPRR